ncbi:transglutaminase-like domain-containing protein [Streptoalloteichus hindustanus]|uniref:Transglutaminase-like superfamily protein n=1 Tax=Streptoalloteichus hindustanus TaxID=2017 RepID=A0A1M5A9W0_STRHI|nr:transglutaminase-like domain-containing protein [Streptoalloteichus hindustanus]SHF27100.1 Transglutaminase-like superfamily protein [Streptoalloteichus hindustanus]
MREKKFANASQPTEFLDFDTREVRRFVRGVAPDHASPRERAVRLYQAVRDGIRYEIDGVDLSRRGLRASAVLRRGQGMCVHKAVLYAAVLRAAGVPSRLVLTDVRNHLSSQRLRLLLGGDVLHYHCLTSMWLDGRWIKASPAFDRATCRALGITPPEFDGRSDGLPHPYDSRGRQHMEFLRFYGEFVDLPYRMVIEGLRAAHPMLFADHAVLARSAPVNVAGGRN